MLRGMCQQRLVLWEPSEEDLKTEDGPTLDTIEVPMVLCKFLRDHQREGVRFMAECVLSQRNFQGSGAILADDMGPSICCVSLASVGCSELARATLCSTSVGCMSICDSTRACVDARSVSLLRSVVYVSRFGQDTAVHHPSVHASL
jgi:hypothetical protein